MTKPTRTKRRGAGAAAARASVHGTRHLVLPDTQVKPGVRTDHLLWAAKYANDKRPDVIVHLGDHYDMPSLSSYDKGKGAAEGRRVIKDIQAGNDAVALFTNALEYKPRMVKCIGNHTQRIARYVNDNPELEGTIGYHLLDFERLGWEVHEFLKPVTIDGVTYCHYFPRSGDGKVSQTKRGAPSARAQVLREMRTCIAGHQQGLDTHIHHTGSRTIRGIVAGSFYQHEESYLSPQGNSHWHGILYLTEVKDGEFNLCEVSLGFLKRKYGKK